jgi:DNA-binding CsgD family transcriptional regulator
LAANVERAARPGEDLDPAGSEWLDLPIDYSSSDIDGFANVPSVEAFVHAMRLRRPGFNVDYLNQPLIAKICWTSGGRLADILLAARMSHSEGFGAVADALEASDWCGDLPRLVRRHAPPQSVFDLSDARVRVLGLVAGMRSGFSVDAIRAVSDDKGIRDVEDVLYQLVSDSLLAVTPGPAGKLDGIGDIRFQVPLLASAIAERARALSGFSKKELRWAHARYFLELAGRHAAELHGCRQDLAVRVLQADGRNIEDAVRFLIANGPGEDSPAVVRVLDMLIPFWMRYGQADRAARVRATALDLRTRLDPDLAAELQVIAAETFARVGEIETAGRLLDELDAAGVGSPERVGGAASRVRGVCTAASGLEQGVVALRTVLAGTSRSGQETLRLALDLSLAEYLAGRSDAATALARRALADATLDGDELAAGAALLRLAVYAAGIGQARQSGELLERAFAKLRKLGPRGVVGELSAMAGSYLVTSVTTRACNVAQVLGVVYARYRYAADWNYPDFAVGDMEGEIRDVLGQAALTANLRAGAATPVPQLLSAMAARRTSAGPLQADDDLPSGTVPDDASEWASGKRPAAALPGTGSALTAREREVARLVGEGLTNRQIARTLAISEWTVVNHMRQIMRKLRFTSRVQVAKWVYSGGQGGIA